METVLALVQFFSCGLAAMLFAAGLQASFNGGPGVFELAGMLWRGEIKSRKRTSRYGG